MTNSRSSKISLWIKLIILLVLAVEVAFLIQNRGPNPVLQHGTNVNAAIYLDDVFRERLEKQYAHLYHAMDQDSPPLTYIVPGMIQTRTLFSSGKNRGLEGTSTAMDPQGLAIVEEYLVISAYDKNHEFNSVLYIVDKKTADYIKTVVLPGTPHVGGLAYDPTSGYLWLTSDSKKGKAQLAAIHLDTLKKDDFANSKKAIAYDAVEDLHAVPKSSFLAYHSNTLYVGYFDKKGSGFFASYPITEQGLPQTKAMGQVELRSSDTSKASFQTLRQLQGASFYKGFLLFSQSYGKKDSRLVIFDNDGQRTWIDFDKDDSLMALDFPPYMEQIINDGTDLYVLFESPARKYRRDDDILHVDRVLKFDMEKLLKSTN